jgi:hypothetical protein
MIVRLCSKVERSAGALPAPQPTALMPRDFIPAVQSKVARVSAGATALRGQQTPGLTDAARSYLATLSLRQFGVSRRTTFDRRLDTTTESLRRALPRGARTWGMARRVLNIFLRNALYDFYLRKKYRLGRAEGFFEVPVDSIVARELRQELGRGLLPRWHGVKYLTPNDNLRYQQAARSSARKLGLPAVHLDTYWWGGSR